MTVVGEGTYELGVNDARVRSGLSEVDRAVTRSGTTAEQTFRQRIGGGINSVGSGLDNVTRKGGLFNAALAGIGVGAGVAGFAAVGRAVDAVTDFLGESVTAAREEEAEIATLTRAIQENDKGWDGNVDAIERVLSAREDLGFSDSEQRDSLRSLVSVTGDVNKALAIQRTAMDLARLKGLDLGTATTLLGKVYAGNLGILARYGIQLKAGTTATEALAEIQRRAAGQAEAFANTSAGASKRLEIQWHELQEQVGKALLPALTDLTNFAVHDLIPALMAVGHTAGDIARIIGPILSPLFDHFGETVTVIGLALTGKLVYGLGLAAKGMLATAEATTAASVATAEHAAAENAAVGATEASTAATEGHAAALDATVGSTEAATAAIEGEIAAEEGAVGATEAHAVAAESESVALAGQVGALEAASAAEAGLTVGLDANTVATEANAAATDAGAAAHTRFSLSARAGAIAALASIPILYDLTDAVGKAALEFAHGEKFGDDFDRILKDLQGDVDSASEVMAVLEDAATRQGRSINDVTNQWEEYRAQGLSAADAAHAVLDEHLALAAAGDALVESYRLQAEAAKGAGAAAGGLNVAYASLGDEIKNKLDKALYESGAMLTQAGAIWAARLSDGSTVFATSAEELANKVPEAQKAAQEEAKRIAKNTPYEIAKSFRQGEDAVYQAALALGEQQTRAQDLTNELVQKQAELAAGELAKQLKSKDPATRAAAIEHANQLRREIFGLRAELDPKAALASRALQDALHSADPQTRRFAEGLASALSDEILANSPELNRLADEYGLTLPEAIDKHNADAHTAGARQADAAIAGIIERRREAHGAGALVGSEMGQGLGSQGPRATAYRSGDSIGDSAHSGFASNAFFSWGQNAAYAWANGLASQSAIVYAYRKAQTLAGSTHGPLKYAGSPDYTRIRQFGHDAAIAWADAIAGPAPLRAAESAARALADQAARYLRELPAALPAPAPGLAPGPLQAAVGIAPGVGIPAPMTAPLAGSSTTDARQFILNVDGEKPVVSTARELIDQLSRVAAFGTIGYLPNGSSRQ